MKGMFETIHGNEYQTPAWLFDELNREFNFSFDLACTSLNKKCNNGFYIDKGFNSLEQEWHRLDGWLWLNPPYSPLKPWIEKCQEESLKGAKIVALVPPVVSTRYFQKQLPSEIRYILGRVPFILQGKEMKGNTNDSAILIYGPPKQSKISYVELKSFKESGNGQ